MAELIEYSISYGECVGYCTSTLTIDGSVIELVQEGNGPDVEERRFAGEIAERLGQRIASVTAELEQETLSDVYGTPDARDEGAVTVRLRGGAGETGHTYSRGGAPSEFAELDDLLSPIVLGWIDGEDTRGVRFDEIP
jgi:hypothetical protein